MPRIPGRVRRSRRRSTIADTTATFNAEQQNEEAHSSSSGVSKEDLEERPAKRAKHRHVESDKTSEKIVYNKTERCNICRQKIDDYIKIYEGPPNNASEEMLALTDDKLSIDSQDDFPQHKLTHFSVFDRNSHLCPFDTGLVDENVQLFFSGYIKPVYEDDASPEGGVPAEMMGPIAEWYIAGFDGGDLALVYIKSPYAEYILMEPSAEYAPIFKALKAKSYLSKYIIEFLLDETEPTYEDLINKLETIVPPDNLEQFTEESLLTHAQFICDRVLSFDADAEEEDTLFITTPCMRSLVDLAGVTLGRKNALREIRARRSQRNNQQTWTKATTTRLVNDVFEHVFSDQLIEHDNEISKKHKMRCGVCGHCESPDCGECAACKAMVKFGGTGKSKQACTRRRCPNMAIKLANESDVEDDDQLETMTEDMSASRSEENSDTKTVKELSKDIAWLGEKIVSDKKRTFYTGVTVGDEMIEVNDCVLVEPNDSSVPPYVAKVVYLWETNEGAKMFHANWFYRGNETILQETSHPAEIFLSDQCKDLPFSSIRSKCTVIHKKAPENWAELGNTDWNVEDEKKYKDGKTFFYQKRYLFETCRFEDPLPELECTSTISSHCFCAVCARVKELDEFNTPKVSERKEEKCNMVTYGLVQYKGEDYTVQSAVFLSPKAFSFKYKLKYSSAPKRDDVDPELYPEYYRKRSDYVKGSNFELLDPFCIGCISEIYATTNKKEPSLDDIYIKVNKLYRPENTHKGATLVKQEDLNKLYWSDEVCTINFGNVVGKCYLAYSENITIPIDDWTDAGPYRFYFSEAYDIEHEKFEEPCSTARNLGRSTLKGSKGNVKLKGNKSKISEEKEDTNKPIEYKIIGRKLRTLDVFSGCGGLSEGLHQSGISETLWAIEKEKPAANAFRLNNPQATVYEEDCNILLKKVMDGETTDKWGQKLPQKGDVEILCGGPPCQGFSGMNRFNKRQYSLFKNSLVVSFLSYCDYYRPKFFIMENVHNFLSFKKHVVLKLTLRCLIRMGYQCAFESLQAGNYGVPQSRRRAILLAAAPGQTLPKYPEAMHVFRKHFNIRTYIGKKYYDTTRTWTSAPYRTITVKDAIFDLPEIKNGCSTLKMPYTSDPVSHFQRKIRRKLTEPMLRDHICKTMNPLILTRISHIPLTVGADWRDLPNIAITLGTGYKVKKLEYTHDDKKMGRAPTGALRGVCNCAEGDKCDPMARQFDTLIPWCLPHTGTRHNHWAGLYGRLEWDGFFSTTVTIPEPMGKQGRVLHPVQNRVVSVRECARSQGFPDYYQFHGEINDKHRQIGNAVPPPLAAAIGHEIRKCIRDTDVIPKIESELTEDIERPTTSREYP
ncbi:DNA (cytosine-5)-methyltransferase PliMCI-like [Ceratina calcarata]|uniref:DNA (cytosine-5)-methyltransferase n=1 Tax=Ceratina calcarata TaxID=156304 RepID=A0AAJ7S452_9HYME|nr:DNA (cytosine-5)-methyltransferase PliMCI-like [Ceratina calcarata]XP_017883669.1 DNA (cytosine-5)-methyltransferase PliMCI-like [Ceratina calcarata]XP_026671098.1 DNA (cytosine-5)-methyltransferase PliMCI-like [Ceratina calcarata]XP_026671099.1 DNA (cytosine-5)-methyltransferase PliMCI-like [Ceratina calcarata]